MMKILLATDGSEYSKVAVEELARMPFQLNTEVRILSVFDNSLASAMGSVPMGGLPSTYNDAILIAKEVSEKNVKDAAKSLKKANSKLSITTTVVPGSPKNAILDESENYGANLIVVGSHGYGAFSRFLLGSVSQAVSLHANCSVLIVRKQDVTEKRKL
ncbi:universal stress protein [Yeosuana aromativorans]|uniref:Universal stress protein n=2 Tax=Yeosuana aromativorans TaxID=288019 RepID=A0A8J3BG23_9FLAO|nr:universal stress protein [Yeosuana aromativorans]